MSILAQEIPEEEKDDFIQWNIIFYLFREKVCYVAWVSEENTKDTKKRD